jgi:hypothetical protein
MLSGGIAVGLLLAGIADDLVVVQAVFYSAAIIFSGPTSDQWLLTLPEQAGFRAWLAPLTKFWTSLVRPVGIRSTKQDICC